MFRHVVMFKWNDDVDAAHIAATGAALDALVAGLPDIVRDYRHGPDLGLTDGNYDYVIVGEYAIDRRLRRLPRSSRPPAGDRRLHQGPGERSGRGAVRRGLSRTQPSARGGRRAPGSARLCEPTSGPAPRRSRATCASASDHGHPEHHQDGDRHRPRPSDPGRAVHDDRAAAAEEAGDVVEQRQRVVERRRVEVGDRQPACIG